jgi:hypothetical protein
VSGDVFDGEQDQRRALVGALDAPGIELQGWM